MREVLALSAARAKFSAERRSRSTQSGEAPMAWMR